MHLLIRLQIIYIPHSSDKTKSPPISLHSFAFIYIPHSSDKTYLIDEDGREIQIFTFHIVQIKHCVDNQSDDDVDRFTFHIVQIKPL